MIRTLIAFAVLFGGLGGGYATLITAITEESLAVQIGLACAFVISLLVGASAGLGLLEHFGMVRFE